MAAIRYLVPYQVDILANDLTSGKRIGNTFYLKSALQTVAPPAYGAVIAGTGSTTTLLTSFKTAWETLIGFVLSTKYKLSSYTMQAIVGYGYGTTLQAINALVIGPVVTTISTPLPHGLLTGDFVKINGVTTPAAANGTWSITVINSTTFTVPVATAGPWAGPGTVQEARGRQQFQYLDKEVLGSGSLGGVAGDALPIFTDVDVRRLNSGSGKSYRSRFAAAPIAESDNDFGKLTAAAILTWAAALGNFNTGFANGGTDATSSFSYSHAVSRLLASRDTTPFVSSNTWTSGVTSYLAHVRLGSQVNRKPKLSGV